MVYVVFGMGLAWGYRLMVLFMADIREDLEISRRLKTISAPPVVNQDGQTETE